MRSTLLALSLVLTFSCSTAEKKSAEPFNWKVASKKLTHEYAKSSGWLYPEWVSGVGFSQFEHLTTPWSKDYQQEEYVHAYQWKSRLEKMLEKETNVEYRADIKILLDQVTREMESIEFNREIGSVSYIPLTESVFHSLNELLYEDASEKKKKNALSRFRLIVRGDEEQLPLVDGYMAHMLNQMKNLEEKRKRGFWPLKSEIETYLKDADGYLESIYELLTKTKTEEWKRDFEELKAQDANYREFLKKKVLPYARTSQQMPEKVYAFILRNMGIKDDPRNLIEVAKKDYRATYYQFSELAREIAREQKLEKNDPVSVVQYLTSKKITDKDELLKVYNKVNDDLYKIVTTNKILTIREKPNMIIRFATKAEAQSLPAPYFNNSPFFGKDKDRPSQFVITPSDGGRDDFSFLEAAITLTAHEAMPGHALQYHMMRERGTTLMRSWLAFNSVNVEGWGLYAEDLVYPYLSKEAQFITLQRRLWRQARMFLDPELNLGLIKGERVFDVFMKELGFSKLFAESEFRRYSYIMPGQANAYYYGYKKLMEMKKKVPSTLCFNDAVLNYGILPLEEISARVEKLNCAESF